MPEVRTYPEMNAQIVGLLRLSDEPIDLYAAQYIEELQKKCDSARGGHWISKNHDGSWRVDTCSVCKKDTHYVRYAKPYDFCPNCGADLRGKTNGD